MYRSSLYLSFYRFKEKINKSPVFEETTSPTKTGLVVCLCLDALLLPAELIYSPVVFRKRPIRDSVTPRFICPLSTTRIQVIGQVPGQCVKQGF
jgi:hypothetical protein